MPIRSRQWATNHFEGRLFVRAAAGFSVVETLSSSPLVGYDIPYEMVVNVYVLCLRMKDGIVSESKSALVITIEYWNLPSDVQVCH